MTRPMLAALLSCAILTFDVRNSEATDCAPIAIDTAAYPSQVALSARGGSIWAYADADEYAPTGGRWFAERPVGSEASLAATTALWPSARKLC